MMEWLGGLPHTLQALLGTLFTWGITALGAALVFFFKRPGKTLLDGMLGFAAGVMVAASFWSLLSPGLELAQTLQKSPFLTVFPGFLSGGLLLYAGDTVYGRLCRRQQGMAHKRIALLVGSITLHNIPEGLAVGVAFGSLAYGLEGASLGAAALLTLGIGLQNFPEGTAVSVPLRREGMSRGKAFFVGQLSGAVEPVAGVVGAWLALEARSALPFLLAFAAGAMIYVVVEELVPQSQTNRRKDVMALCTLLGFLLMMILDVTLG